MRMRWTAAVMMLAVSGVALGQATLPADPATKSAMPPGHPSIESMMAAKAAQEGGMPASSQPGMPPGHPSIDQMMAAKAGTSTMPANPHGAGGVVGQNAVGSVEVHVVPATPGGPAPQKTKVFLTWQHPTMSFRPREAEMNDSGVARFDNVPLGMVAGMTAMLSVQYEGVEQTMPGIQVTPDSPNPKVDFKVYGTTTEQPKWNVALRHVDVLEWNRQGARIHEEYTVHSAGDRIWVGTGEATKRATLAFPLPAEHSELASDLNAAVTRLESGSLVTGTPIFPGDRTYTIEYTVAVKDGKLNIALPSPAGVDKVMVHVPADSAKVNATGLSLQPMGAPESETKLREYGASGVAAGTTLELAVSGIDTLEESAWSAKNVAVGGGLLVLVVGAVLMLKKPKKAKEDKKAVQA